MRGLHATARILLGALLCTVVLACPEKDPAPPQGQAPGGTTAATGGDSGDGAGAAPEQQAATPVRTATVERASLDRTVTAPGEVVALVEQRVRAPFAGVITALDVVVGDRVKAGQRVGQMVARDAEAAVAGAREMLRAAETAQEKADAQRALELARKHLVRSPLTTSVGGLVTARTAAPGDRVSEGQELLTVIDTSSLVFRAHVAQSDLADIAPGETAQVQLSGTHASLPGQVHGVLPGIDPEALTAPVRIDLARRPKSMAPGLFGTATIVVGTHPNALVVPEAALLRDDVQGTVRVGQVRPDGTLHWVQVQPGLSEGGRVEVIPVEGGDALAAGDVVATAGHVGLPEGAKVTATP